MFATCPSKCGQEIQIIAGLKAGTKSPHQSALSSDKVSTSCALTEDTLSIGTLLQLGSTVRTLITAVQ